jgi:hypothetical protein
MVKKLRLSVLVIELGPGLNICFIPKKFGDSGDCCRFRVGLLEVYRPVYSRIVKETELGFWQLHLASV